MSDQARFSDAELEALLADAFTAACWPATRVPLEDRRLRYLEAAALEIVTRLTEAVTAGDIGRYELPLVLTGAALGALRIARSVTQ